MNDLKLSTLDFLISVADTRTRPLDFALILHLRNALSTDALRAGATSARCVFPTTGSYVRGRRWLRTEELNAGVKVKPICDGEARSVMEQFLDEPFDPEASAPIKQLLLVNGTNDTRTVLTRFHHVAVDGLSAAMWLRHQLRVAHGLDEHKTESEPQLAPALRRHKSPVKRSMFAFEKGSTELWNHDGEPTHRRLWNTFQIDAPVLREYCRKARGFTYNDLLATALLEVLARWNETHLTKHRRNVSLWFPVDIRKKALPGFGNGTSRIRIYANYDDSLSLAEKCRLVRRQITWSIQNGEWAIPSNESLSRWPLWALKPLLRRYLARPSVDMCTSVFSHVERLGSVDDPVFQNVEQVECVGLLHKSHCLAVNAATLHGRTSLTFTYDPNLLTPTDIERMIEMYKEQIRESSLLSVSSS